jgi:hypothetical protein
VRLLQPLPRGRGDRRRARPRPPRMCGLGRWPAPSIDIRPGIHRVAQESAQGVAGGPPPLSIPCGRPRGRSPGQLHVLLPQRPQDATDGRVAFARREKALHHGLRLFIRVLDPLARRASQRPPGDLHAACAPVGLCPFARSHSWREDMACCVRHRPLQPLEKSGSVSQGRIDAIQIAKQCPTQRADCQPVMPITV